MSNPDTVSWFVVYLNFFLLLNCTLIYYLYIYIIEIGGNAAYGAPAARQQGGDAGDYGGVQVQGGAAPPGLAR